MKTVEIVVVTDHEQQPAFLTFEDEPADAGLTLTVEGVQRAPRDLPKEAFLKVADPALAARAAVAGFATKPLTKAARRRQGIRRRHRILGRVYASFLIVGVVLSIFWLVVALVDLDLVRAIQCIGLAIFLAFLALVWWVGGEEIGLAEDADRRRRSRAFWSAFKDFRAGGRKP